MNKMHPKPHWAAVWQEEHECWVVQWQCRVCDRCWMKLSGMRKGQCIHGGPYMGYVIVRDE